MKNQDDTIAAIITPIGEGGISVLRLSGSRAIEIAETGFRGKQKLNAADSHTVHLGSYVDSNGELLDEVLTTVFIAPHSYTGEDVIEISCHGSILVTKRILESLLHAGARMAEPGEFTKRAYLNGKMDLTQAEAVADLIRTRSDQSYKASLLQLKGSTSKAINSIRDKLLNICSLIELELDFSEEGIELIDKAEIDNRFQSVINEIEALIGSYDHGRVLREGVKVVIFGKPNVGKSSLMNALLDQERAIVTHISGTTRDTIEESIHINGIIFRLVDTAGVRETEDIIEKEGINRTKNEIQEADVVIHLLDASSFSMDEYTGEKNSLLQVTGQSKKIITVLNKGDLLFTEEIADSKDSGRSQQSTIAQNDQFPDVIRMLVDSGDSINDGTVIISAKHKTGLDALKNRIYSLTVANELSQQEGTVIITNLRHKELLVLTYDSLAKSLQSVKDSMSGEFIAADLRSALHFLGEITGEITTDDILNNIFSKFCIGK